MVLALWVRPGHKLVNTCSETSIYKLGGTSDTNWPLAPPTPCQGGT